MVKTLCLYHSYFLVPEKYVEDYRPRLCSDVIVLS
jgi:hypothetical protein